MWNKNKSITLTHLLVRACYVFLAITAIGLPFLMKSDYRALASVGVIDYVIGSLLAVIPAGYIVLICLDKLLINVKNEAVFNEKNVKLLRVISWACFFAALVGVLTFMVILIKMRHILGFISGNILFFLAILALAAGEAFVGLVVRVVKNVFEAAIEIKEENELTI